MLTNEDGKDGKVGRKFSILRRLKNVDEDGKDRKVGRKFSIL